MPLSRRLPLVALLTAALGPADPSSAEDPWPPAAVNPKPLADDVLVAMPCGGAMAFRPVMLPAAGKDPPGFEGLHTPLRTSAGQPYLLIGKYEVATRQYRAVHAYALGEDCPPPRAHDAVAKGGVSWKTAAGFGDDWRGWMLTAGRELPDCEAPGQGAAGTPCIPRGDGQPAVIRLPTEQEWEYAARGGFAVTPEQFQAGRYPMTGPVDAHAWISSNARGAVQPIGQLRANPLGLHDVYGNVAEVMAGIGLGETRFGEVPVFMLRGGSRYSGAAEVGSSARQQASLYDVWDRKHTSDAGFRLVIGDVQPVISRAATGAPPRSVGPLRCEDRYLSWQDCPRRQPAGQSLGAARSGRERLGVDCRLLA